MEILLYGYLAVAVLTALILFVIYSSGDYVEEINNIYHAVYYCIFWFIPAIKELIVFIRQILKEK